MNDKKAGLGIGIITRGTVSIKWMSHMEKLKRFFPVGMFWKYIIVEGTDGWAKNRIEVVKRAQKENFEWLLFIDDDVFVPKDIMRTILQHQKDIVTGIYWTKTDSPVPVIFENEGAGPMFKFPIDKLFKVAGSGLGCCLINMKVFDDFDKAGIPYFKENWVMTLDDGRNMKCPVGEDHYFFHHARKLGYDVWADSGLLCDHYNMNNKQFYPGEDIVREVVAVKLEEEGREDVIDEVNKHIGKDPNKETIVFVNYTANHFSGDELSKRGVGGAESCIINLARTLTKKYNVHVYTNDTNPGVYDGVVYKDAVKSLLSIKDLNPDLLIISRNIRLLGIEDFKKDFNAKKVCLWVHDVPQDPNFKGFEKTFNMFDNIIALSNYHKEEICKEFPMVDKDKVLVFKHGLDVNRFINKVEKIPGRMVYSSTPYRGLEVLADVFPKIKERVPEASLKVFSSMKVYGSDDEEEFQSLYHKLEHMDGVEYCGTVKQDELAQEFMKAELLVYPNTFPETFCLTAIEAQAAGTPIVTTDFAALKEITTAVKIKGKPYSKEYKDKFIDAVVDILTDTERWKTLSDAGLKQDVSWDTAAKQWTDLFFNEESIKQVGNINTPLYWDTVYNDEIVKGRIRTTFSRVNYVKKFINDGDKMLDIGCGTGEFTRQMKLSYPNAEIWGSDFSMVAIDFCRQRNRTIYYANHPILNDNFEEKFFDVITILHVLEHLDKPEDMITRAHKLLKPHGKLILAIPLNDEWREHLKVWHLNDIEELLSKFHCEYTIKKQVEDNRKYDDGSPLEEAIVVVEFT